MPSAEYVGTASEASWQQTILDSAGFHGWRLLMSIPDAGLASIGNLIDRAKKGTIRNFPLKGLLALLGAIAGWPDLTLGHPGQKRLIFIEVKANDGTVRPKQKAMIALLRECGQDVYVLKPKDKDGLDAILR